MLLTSLMTPSSMDAESNSWRTSRTVRGDLVPTRALNRARVPTVVPVAGVDLPVVVGADLAVVLARCRGLVRDLPSRSRRPDRGRHLPNLSPSRNRSLGPGPAVSPESAGLPGLVRGPIAKARTNDGRSRVPSHLDVKTTVLRSRKEETSGIRNF